VGVGKDIERGPWHAISKDQTAEHEHKLRKKLGASVAVRNGVHQTTSPRQENT